MTLKSILFGAAAAVLLASSPSLAPPALADQHEMGASGTAGAEMTADKTIVESAAETPDLSRLVSAVQAAELAETLAGAGPFTVFAPTNEAFEALPEEAASELMKPENKGQLQNVLTYHVIADEVTADELVQAIEENNGQYELETVAGAKLTAMLEGDDVVLTDESGGKARVTAADMKQSNGVVHVIDKVLMPQE